jgi:hypothetical protein
MEWLDTLQPTIFSDPDLSNAFLNSQKEHEMTTRTIVLTEGESITLKVYDGKWAQAWTRVPTGEELAAGQAAKETGYLSTPKLMCPSHRDMGEETWEGPGVVIYETRNYM